MSCSRSATAAGRTPATLVLTAADGSLAGYAHLDGPDDAARGGDASGELVVHPAWRRRRLGAALASALLGGAAGQSGPGRPGVRLWAHGELPGAVGLAKSAGFTRFRALLRLRMPLALVPQSGPAQSGTARGGPSQGGPALPPGVTVRTFRPGADEEAWLAVNRRAFAHHPEQGSWTMADLRLRESEAWFDPDGFFLAERDGRLAGFHWTKVHQPDGGPGGAPVGEVYVVGVDLQGTAGRRPGAGADPDRTRSPQAAGAGRGHAVRRRIQHCGGSDVHGAGLHAMVNRRDVPAPLALADPERLVELTVREWPVARGDSLGGSALGVEFDLSPSATSS